MKLGKIKRITDLRSIWPHEANDFTQWLADEHNLAKLGEEIGIELELEERESSVGNFNVDLYAKEEGTGRKVIIENQLEETEVGVGVLVEPFNGLAVFIAGALHHPYHHLCPLARGVGDEFAQVVVVGFFKLVFNDNLSSRALFFGIEVHIEIADRRLSFFQFQFNAYFLAQFGEVVLISQTLGKVVGFVRPNRPQVCDSFYLSEFH